MEKTLHKHKPNELLIKHIGKRIEVYTLTDLAMTKLKSNIEKAKKSWNKITNVDEFLKDFKL